MISLTDLTTPLNPLVIALLRSRLHGIGSRQMMVVSWTGRKSGRRFSIPVAYQRKGADGREIVVLISKVNKKRWWKNFREPWPAELLLRGRVREATGHWVEPGSDEYFDKILMTFERMPWLGGQMGITYRKGEALSEEQQRVLCRECGVVRFATRQQGFFSGASILSQRSTIST